MPANPQCAAPRFRVKNILVVIRDDAIKWRLAGVCNLIFLLTVEGSLCREWWRTVLSCVWWCGYFLKKVQYIALLTVLKHPESFLLYYDTINTVSPTDPRNESWRNLSIAPIMAALTCMRLLSTLSFKDHSWVESLARRLLCHDFRSLALRACRSTSAQTEPSGVAVPPL